MSDQNLEEIHRRQFATLKAFENVTKPIRKLLGQFGVKRLFTEEVIFTYNGEGMTAHTSVVTESPVTVGDLEKSSHIVGVLVNTAPLVDLVTEFPVPPGVYAVSLRHLGHGEFAFDLINGDGTRVHSAPARMVDEANYLWAQKHPDVDLFDGQASFRIADFQFGCGRRTLSFLWWEWDLRRGH